MLLKGSNREIRLRGPVLPAGAGARSACWHEWPQEGAAFGVSVSEESLGNGSNCRLVRVEAAPARKSAAGRSVAFISDLHWDGTMAGLYERLASAINALEADWIVFGGDLCMYMDKVPEAMEWLGTLKAGLGKCAVPGNRESPVAWLDTAFWKKAYGRAGFTYLCNECLDADTFVLFGLDDARFGKPDWGPLAGLADSSRPVLCISHNPDAAGLAGEHEYIGDMLLCGHTHSGQICLPWYGPLYSSSIFGRQFLHGLKQRGDGTLCLVSSGIGEAGCSFFKRRVLCPREIVFLRF